MHGPQMATSSTELQCVNPQKQNMSCCLTSPQNGNDLKKSNGYEGIRDIMFFCKKDYKAWTDIYNLYYQCSSVNIAYCSHK